MAESKLIQMLEQQECLIKSRPERLSRLESVNEDTTVQTPLEFKPGIRNSEAASLKDDNSMMEPLLFKDGPQPANHSSGEAVLKGDSSMIPPMLFKEENSNQSLDEFQHNDNGPQLQTHVVSIFTKLEETIMSFVRTELRKFQTLVSAESAKGLAPVEDDEAGTKEAFLRITLSFLRSMNEHQLADRLHSRDCAAKCQGKLKSHLQQRYQCVFEGVAKAGSPTLLNQIYTELYITEGGGGVNQEHEVRHLETAARKHSVPETAIPCEDIFKDPANTDKPIRAELVKEPIRTERTQGPMRTERTQGPIRTELTNGPIRTELTNGPIRTELTKGPIRTELTNGPIRTERTQGPIITERTRGPIRVVLTKGGSGIGKSILTQKFSLDWAEGRANQDIQLLFPFTFRELNVLRNRQFSLVGLLQHFFSESKGLCSLQHLQVVFIFDGLDECRLPLDFTRTQDLSDPTESGSVDVLLVNLIRGSLLPSARLWITTRPAAANQIPAECISMVTEVRGFSDPQKEQYFRKRFRDQQANAIISHIKTSRVLHMMCKIPVFCWIISTVLENSIKTTKLQELPKTLTNLYIHFLVVQAKVKSLKYGSQTETNSQSKKATKKMVKALGKVAFEQLQKGNLIFYESDLRQCGLEPTEASVYSGMFTQVFREEPGLYQDKVYCFIHLSVQEFLAALHVHRTFVKTGVNLLTDKCSGQLRGRVRSFYQSRKSFHRSAVDLAVQSPNGHLDLFLRFLLGLSLPTNQGLLRSLLSQTQRSSENNQKTIEYIKHRINQDLPVEKSLNLFHCLNELNDCSLLQQLQDTVRCGRLDSQQLSPAQWSALVFILLTSDSHLDHFSLKPFSASEEALLRLLPVVTAANKALLDDCNLSWHSCDLVYSVLHCPSSLRHLDVSNNDLQDSGVELLCSGLESHDCKLHTLRLSRCMISEKGCTFLASALNSNPSHLRELDVSYNHPGASGAELLRAVQRDPRCRLDTLRLDPCGPQWLKPGLWKYYCKLTWDPNTVHPNLRMSTVVSQDEEQPYPDHPDRFEWFLQLLCSEALIGCCYFEVEWSGRVHIGVTYKGIQRKGKRPDAVLGGSDQSWCLSCSDGGYSFYHNNTETVLQRRPGGSRRVGVYVDSEGGAVCFYSVSSDKRDLLYSFSTAFTHTLFAGFGFRFGFPGSTLSLCRADGEEEVSACEDEDQNLTEDLTED